MQLSLSFAALTYLALAALVPFQLACFHAAEEQGTLPDQLEESLGGQLADEEAVEELEAFVLERYGCGFEAVLPQDDDELRYEHALEGRVCGQRRRFVLLEVHGWVDVTPIDTPAVESPEPHESADEGAVAVEPPSASDDEVPAPAPAASDARLEDFVEEPSSDGSE